MAIDDNANYTLTGAQVKDLAQRVRSGGGTAYTAGSGITISNNEISVDSTEVPFLTALAAVATSGDYDDLLNKPTIPAAQVNSDWDAASGVAQILNKPSLATVATSGSYNDLSNKPTIPTVNDATLTIQKNGTTVKTFTANASSDVTANITVPTQFSDLSGTVGSTQFANNTIDKAKINWSTMRATFTGTTDGNGFIAVPTGTVRPTTGFILGARRVKASDSGQTDGILLPYTDHSQSRYTLKFINWNMQANGNQTIKVDIIYCLLS